MMLGTKILEERTSKFNEKLRVVKTIGLGTYIQVNGITQSGGIVEKIWGSTLKELEIKKVDKCLILGLGGGTTAMIAKKLWPRVFITGVEIDPSMLKLGKKYLDLDVDKIYVEDAERFVRRIKKKYDLVIIDTYFGDEFPRQFEESAFLKLISKILSKNGAAIFNRLYYGDKRKEAVKFGSKLEKVFSNVVYFYPEANIMFICS